MPPKKNQRHNQKQRRTAPNSSSSSTPSSAPKLQISAQNENRLRRLLLNSAPPASSLPPLEHPLSKPHQAKKLTALYEKLSCEGFTNHQIELALTALKGSATFEVVLDWLCLNLPSNEIPLKFSSGTSTEPTGGGSVGVLLTAREDSIRLVDRSSEVEEEEPEFSVRIKPYSDDTTLDAHHPSQADWIKQYVRQQEETVDSLVMLQQSHILVLQSPLMVYDENLEKEDYTRWEDDAVNNGSYEEARRLRTHDVIVNEYSVARFEAAQAKLKGDKQSQEKAEKTIRDLKQEILAFGISDDVLASEFRYENASKFLSENTSANSIPSDCLVVERSSDIVGNWDAEENLSDDNKLVGLNAEDFPANHSIPIAMLVQKEKSSDEQEVELGDLFDEDAPEMLHDSMKLRKKERMKDIISEKNLDKLTGIWKKGDPRKIPKAVLHQLCQKSGWEAPKFSKVDKKENSFSYAVSILHKASGRGKSRKPGGLTILKLRPEEEAFESAEDSQNRVAAFALSQFFPDLPLHVLLNEPYASLLLQWQEGEPAGSSEESEEARRAGFVNSLLDSSYANSTGIDESKDSSLCGKMDPFCYKKTETLGISAVDRVTARQNSSKVDAFSSYLLMELENKMAMPKYQDILKARASLPVADLKGDIIKLLKENNVLVVSGETGSGKTTQVPQFILDDMIKSGRGGYCNIICTQPRRIAAISVAERVAEERCEPSAGADGSLVGYQVRLESARNESTKLLFCTTGILLRKISGDRNLTGVTHVIVDEVHERSILSDFLLTILKNLVEKNSVRGSSDLKVILMSATVDSNLFSRYFWDCPVIVAQGRSHPVTTYYLEDIYETIHYRLASDSAAFLRDQTSTDKKIAPINNHRGKKNLILSSWGDDCQLYEDSINPNYIAESYQTYSEQTQENLKRLNEDVIDYDLLEDLVGYVDETCDKGAILVFLPGVTEIHMLHDKLTASFRFGGQASDWILPLHSAVSSSDQKKVFLQPPQDIRKVIIATNIAETSITINDVVYVIDCGKHKENRYNPVKKLSSMVEDWISQANSRQRRGRAGRVKPGTCFCLFTRHRFEKVMRPFQVPEMLRMPLVELCLQIKLLSLGHINLFLSQALEPPKEEAIASAVSLLYEVGALEGNEELTPLGHHLARIPVDVLIGKMMLYGAIFGCLSPLLSISAFLSYKSPFIYPKDESQNIERAKLMLLADNPNGSSDSNFGNSQSDHLLMMIAYIKWEKILREKGPKAAHKFCSSYFLNSSVMYMARDMRIQFGTLLADIGFIELPKTYQNNKTKKELLDSWLSDASRPFNLFSQHSSIIKAILCAGLYPNIAANGQGITESSLSGLRHSFDLTTRDLVWYDGKRRVHVHPSSINRSVKAFQYPFLVFLEKVETNKVFLRDTTVVSPYSILLFGGTINIQHQTGGVIIDGWLKLRAPAQTAVLFKELRLTLHSILKILISKPEAAVVMNNEIVRSIVHLLSEEDKPPA